jgi:MYXO-CTERM domain-containing protein
MTKSLLLVLAFLAAAPLASAHITLTVTPPADPVTPFATASIAVAAAADCVDMFVLAPGTASIDRTLELSEATPASFAWTGETLTFPATGCVAGQGTSDDSGSVLITPNGRVPAFLDVPLEVVCDECEEGAFTMQVGYYADVTATVPTGIKAGTPFQVKLDVSTNYDTDLRITVSKAGAKATLASFASEVKVDSPLLINETSRTITLDLQTGGPTSGWTSDEIEITVQPVARGKAINGTAATVKLPIANDQVAASASTSGSKTATGTSTVRPSSSSTSGALTATGTTTADGKKDSPPASPFVALGLVALAVALRRRLAKQE